MRTQTNFSTEPFEFDFAKEFESFLGESPFRTPVGSESNFEYEGTFETNGQQVLSPPALAGQESVPPAKTLYVKIPLGSEKPAKPLTGIYLPPSFQPLGKVDLIIYLHGIKQHPNLSIDQYWNTKYFPYWPLREGLKNSQKNVILVAPTLGPRSQGETGWLTGPGGLDKYLEQVRAALAAYGPHKQTGPPQIGNIILAAHSGGGLPMRRLALGKNLCVNQIKECWGFDCLYFGGDETLWAQWAKARPDAKLYIHYQSSTRARAEKLKQKGIPNISVSRSNAKGHNWVPIHHWGERLTSASLWQSQPSTDHEWGLGSIWNWFGRSGPALPRPSGLPAGAPATAVSPRPYTSLTLRIRTDAVALALQEWNRWGKGAIKETDPAIRSVLEDYWLKGTGSKRLEANWWTAVPWSAAFISWVMRNAGAGSDFKYSASHSVYIADAKANSIANNQNPFKAYPIDRVAARVGDLVCKGRAGSGATYANIKPGMSTHCDIVTAVEPNRLITIGGNVSNSVSQTKVTTDPNGFITGPPYFAVIRVGA